jgi:hypothetical protein
MTSGTKRARRKPKHMTVRDVIEVLQRVPNKDIKVLLDCPYCGRGQQIRGLTEVVVIGGER